MAKLGKPIESYTDSTYFTTNPTRADMRQSDRSASIDDITTYIYQSLLDFQGKWSTSDMSEWVITMPNARYLAIGDSIKNMTTGEFYTISEIINKKSKTIKINGTTAPIDGQVLGLHKNNVINFVSDYSSEYKEKPINDWRDTVTYRITRKEPGTIGKHPFDPPTEIKPRVRQYITDPDYPDAHIKILGQWFDVLIQFDCWAKTNNRADDLISWFEDFMFKYIWVWKKNGVNEILYWMRTQDEWVRQWRNDLSTRSVLYYFKIETITTIREHDFKQLDLYLELANILPSGFYGVGYNELPPSGKTEILDDSFTVYL